ncbi:shieldin complex subunit 3 [Pleurodeles waltl]|uniref:shieldin complex subunit 3 n=1 Tax=Pleurodeles waltl TaxID=8319 RepID=UPI0037097CF9
MSVEVVVHYRPGYGDKRSLQRITEAALEKFPTRIVPKFMPWFSNENSKHLLKPKKNPPILSFEDVENIRHKCPASQLLTPSQGIDCTRLLLEFHPNLSPRKPLFRSQTVPLDVDCGNFQKVSLNKIKALRRRWSVSIPSDRCKNKIIPLSKELQGILDRLNLHSFCRARWTIEESVCVRHTLEDTWALLNSIIRHKELPLCNATIQRDIGQILVFCDIFCCEYVGGILKKRLHLVGNILLHVHKYGIIFSL